MKCVYGGQALRFHTSRHFHNALCFMPAFENVSAQLPAPATTPWLLWLLCHHGPVALWSHEPK